MNIEKDGLSLIQRMKLELTEHQAKTLIKN